MTNEELEAKQREGLNDLERAYDLIFRINDQLDELNALLTKVAYALAPEKRILHFDNKTGKLRIEMR